MVTLILLIIMGYKLVDNRQQDQQLDRAEFKFV